MAESGAPHVNNCKSIMVRNFVFRYHKGTEAYVRVYVYMYARVKIYEKYFVGPWGLVLFGSRNAEK